MNEQKNVNELMDEIELQVAQMDLASQLSFYQATIDSAYEEIADLSARFAEQLEELIEAETGDEVTVDIDDEQVYATATDEDAIQYHLGVLGDSLEELADEYRTQVTVDISEWICLEVAS